MYMCKEIIFIIHTFNFSHCVPVPGRGRVPNTMMENILTYAVNFGLMHWVHKLSITINYIVPHAIRGFISKNIRTYFFQDHLLNTLL